MSLKIRLKRTGSKHQPTYRIVVVDSRSAAQGKYIELLGHYNPRCQPVTLHLDIEKTKYWLARGAKQSDTVKHLWRGLALSAQR